MTKKPFLLMTDEEIEKMLPQDSKSRAERLHALRHSFSMYDYTGVHIPHPREKENLLEVIAQRDTYVIDSNSRWKKECTDSKFANKAFIISPALSRENQNTKDLILEAKRAKLGNLFSIGIDATIDCLLVDRIDEYFRFAFDDKKLRDASTGRGDHVKRQAEQNEKAIVIDRTLLRHYVRSAFSKAPFDSAQLNAFLTTGRAANLPPPGAIPQTIALLKSDIIRHLPKCRRNVEFSKMTAGMCYAVLLLEDVDTNEAATRVKFDKAGYPHVFGDMYILLTAILLGCNIMTHDVKLMQMAGYACVECRHVPRP